MLSITDVMEQLSLSYARAVGALANCSAEETRVDRDSVDVTFHLRGQVGAPLTSPSLAVQMKSHAKTFSAQATHIPYDLPVKNYNDLVQPSYTPRILVVLCLPKSRTEWAECTADAVLLRRRAFWHNIRGLPLTKNKKTERIQLSTQQVFNPATLVHLLNKAARQEELVL
jgi:hypothetical protein